MTCYVDFECQILALFYQTVIQFFSQNTKFYLEHVVFLQIKNLTNFDPPLEKFHDQTDSYIHNIVENSIKYDLPILLFLPKTKRHWICSMSIHHVKLENRAHFAAGLLNWSTQIFQTDLKYFSDFMAKFPKKSIFKNFIKMYTVSV